MHNLGTITCWAPHLSAECGAALQGLTALTNLQLRGVRNTEQSLLALSVLQQLQWLAVRGNRLCRYASGDVASLTQLALLQVPCWFTDGIHPIPPLPAVLPSVRDLSLGQPLCTHGAITSEHAQPPAVAGVSLH